MILPVDGSNTVSCGRNSTPALGRRKGSSGMRMVLANLELAYNTDVVGI